MIIYFFLFVCVGLCYCVLGCLLYELVVFLAWCFALCSLCGDCGVSMIWLVLCITGYVLG